MKKKTKFQLKRLDFKEKTKSSLVNVKVIKYKKN